MRLRIGEAQDAVELCGVFVACFLDIRCEPNDKGEHIALKAAHGDNCISNIYGQYHKCNLVKASAIPRRDICRCSVLPLDVLLYREYALGYGEVDEQRDRVYDGRDERARHYGGVKADLLGEHRQRTAYELCYNYCTTESYADNECDRNGNRLAHYKIIYEQYLDKGRGCEREAAENGDAQLLPHNA